MLTQCYLNLLNSFTMNNVSKADNCYKKSILLENLNLSSKSFLVTYLLRFVLLFTDKSLIYECLASLFF